MTGNLATFDPDAAANRVDALWLRLYGLGKHWEGHPIQTAILIFFALPVIYLQELHFVVTDGRWDRMMREIHDG